MKNKQEWSKTEIVGIYGFAILAIVLICFLIFISQPTEAQIEGNCHIMDWKKMPDNLSVGDLRMYPNNAQCNFNIHVRAPLGALLAAR